MPYDYETADPLLYHILKQNAKEQIAFSTPAELCLWNHLRQNQLGVRFRRQHPIGEWIADFVCLTNKLIIEVDGGYHFTEEQKAKDQIRTEALEQMGYTVVRFTNEEVMLDTERVVQRIKNLLF